MDLTDKSLRCILICRGLPGSGKNTYAEEHGFTIVDSDSYFMKNGEYVFDYSELGASHTACFRRFLQLLANDVDRIAVCNTNITRAEYSPYVAAARAFDRRDEIRLLLMDCSVRTSIERNTHDVPPEVIGAMNAKYEPSRDIDPPQYSIVTDEPEGNS